MGRDESVHGVLYQFMACRCMRDTRWVCWLVGWIREERKTVQRGCPASPNQPACWDLPGALRCGLGQLSCNTVVVARGRNELTSWLPASLR